MNCVRLIITVSDKTGEGDISIRADNEIHPVGRENGIDIEFADAFLRDIVRLLYKTGKLSEVTVENKP